MPDQFSIFFTGRLSEKFAVNSLLNMPPRLKYAAALPYAYQLPMVSVSQPVSDITLIYNGLFVIC